MPLSHLAVSGTNPVPLYHRAARQLEAVIEAGELRPGEFIDSELDLSATWGVSRPTARRAIQELVDKGLLARRRGVGTQVVDARVRRPMRLSSLWDDLDRAGLAPTTRVLALTREPADDEVAESLTVDPGAPVIHVARIRSVGGRPLAILRNWLPTAFADHLTQDALATTGLYELLRQARVHPRHAHQVVGARLASPQEAELLRLAPDAPLVTMRRVVHDDRGRPVEVGNHVYDATNYAVEMSLQAHA